MHHRLTNVSETWVHSNGRDQPTDGGLVRLTHLRLCGFRCVGDQPVDLAFEHLTFLLGPNGTGKTAFLHALTRMFGSEASLRRIVLDDFHVPLGETPGIGIARSFWLEAEFAFPELSDEGLPQPTIPPNFGHMRMETANDPPTVRFRLTAQLDPSGEITDELTYVLAVDADDEPARSVKVNRFDRAAIQVHYLPARRDPANHVSYAANSLLGRLLRAADWQMERTTVAALSNEISATLAENDAVAGIAGHLATQWQQLHTGAFLTSPGLAFSHSEIEAVLRYVTLEFSPGPALPAVDFSLLSDGQQSLLYIALVLAAHAIGRQVLTDQTTTFDLSRLRPPVFTLLAVEEPENSLSPHYLGRVLTALYAMTTGHDAQAVVATHSPSLIRRVEPEQVRYLRLDPQRRTIVAKVVMPPKNDDAHKFVREALHAYPELYFSRFVVLGEGDSEEIVLPRCLRAAGLEADATSISVVPLGGRHVNHFWHLLRGLDIPHVTLLDLDLGRYQGGWGRIKYGVDQLVRYVETGELGLTQEQYDGLSTRTDDVRSEANRSWFTWLEQHGVFFSNPLDLDFEMIQHLPDAYDITEDELEAPAAGIVTAVLGKKGDAAGYRDDEKALFPAYHQRFKLGSKPAQHITALAKLDDATLETGIPDAIRRLIMQVASKLKELPE